jgi:hypothetical protein
MKLTNTDYHVINKQIAVPTEITDTRGIIQGIVQDSKAYQIKTPIGSAGLFAPLVDLMKFVQCILKNRDQTQAPVFFSSIIPAITFYQYQWTYFWLGNKIQPKSGKISLSYRFFRHVNWHEFQD